MGEGILQLKGKEQLSLTYDNTTILDPSKVMTEESKLRHDALEPYIRENWYLFSDLEMEESSSGDSRN